MIDGYGAFEPLGHGGFSTVYLAHQELFDRVVAVKVLHADLRNPDAQRRFVRECRATGRMTGHSNIITVFDAGTTQDHRPYLAMEYFPGGSLAEAMAASGPLAVPAAVRIGATVAGALSAAHLGGILHRDIKPANILLRRADDPVLSDFGIASIEEGRDAAPASAAFTPGYAAPEVLLGEKPTVAADVFAFGATLFALLAGTPPFPGRVPTQILARIQSGAVEPIGRDDVPDDLRTLMLRMLDAEPSRRPASAADVASELAALLDSRSAGTTRVPSAGLPPVPVPSDNRAATPVSVPVDGAAPPGDLAPASPPGTSGDLPPAIRAIPPIPAIPPGIPPQAPSGTVAEAGRRGRWPAGARLWVPATAVAVVAVLLLLFLLLRPSTGGSGGTASPGGAGADGSTATATVAPTGSGPAGNAASKAVTAATPGGHLLPAAPAATQPVGEPQPVGESQPAGESSHPVAVQPSPAPPAAPPPANNPVQPTSVVTAPPAGGSCPRRATNTTDYRNRTFADRYDCSTYVSYAVYSNITTGQAGEALDDSGYMYEASSVWVICQIRGRANPVVQGNTNTWWLYTQGDDARSNTHGYSAAWGYLPATAVSQGGQNEPIPGVPECGSVL